MASKTCSNPECTEENPQPLENFGRRSAGKGGVNSRCKACHNAACRARANRIADKNFTNEVADRNRRLASEYEPLKASDFDITVGNDGRKDPNADKEKKQEYSRSDGDFLTLLRESGGDPGKMPVEDSKRNAYYLALKSEQENRFQNRRLARTASITQANEALRLRNLMQLAKEYFANKVTPTGFAKKTDTKKKKRKVVVGLSDLHFGSDLRKLDNPTAFGAEEESRRFARVLQNVIHYKPDHREDSTLVLMFNGDLFEGRLGHDLRSGAPLTEQMGATLHYCQQFIATAAAHYPTVEIHWQPGNHGRDKDRHPGRATESKWDGHEWWLGYCLSQMCLPLKNVTFSIPFRAVSTIDLFGKKLLMSHGDTEVKLGHPDSAASKNQHELSKFNDKNFFDFGFRYDLGFFGHFHTHRVYPWEVMRVLFNGALVPSNGYSRTAGYIGERCGQIMFEATPDYPLGDYRFIEVGAAEDKDASLNRLISPFRFSVA